MSSATSLIKTTIKRILAHYDLAILNVGSRFGINYLRDIEKLSRDWNRPIYTFFDVGAHFGETAAAALKQFPNARVYSFEPHPKTFSSLMQNIGDHASFHAENMALGISTATIDLYEYNLSATNSLIPNAPFNVRFPQDGRAIKVSCTTLDHYCAENGMERVDVLKVDTEGNDLNVLKGAVRMLKKGAIDFVYVEFNDLHPMEGATGGALLPIAALLHGYGFRFVASYCDYIVTKGRIFSVSNALFALPPSLTDIG